MRVSIYAAQYHIQVKETTAQVEFVKGFVRGHLKMLARVYVGDKPAILGIVGEREKNAVSTEQSYTMQIKHDKVVNGVIHSYQLIPC